MKLVVDAGSTKIEWAVLQSDGSTHTFESPGVNALMLSEEQLCDTFGEALHNIYNKNITAIYYYGAGCATAETCNKVLRALPQVPVIEVHSDLLGAARALFGSNPGLAGIIGTGSNTGLYDGTSIKANMSPLGYILGDEGSGTAMGRELLRKVYRYGFMRQEFETWLGGDYNDVLQRIYRQPGANAFLASLTRFVTEHRTKCNAVITDTFNPLFTRLREFYGPQVKDVAFVGGLAHAFDKEITDTAQSFGFNVTKILNRPMTGLVEYHKTLYK